MRDITLPVKRKGGWGRFLLYFSSWGGVTNIEKDGPSSGGVNESTKGKKDGRGGRQARSLERRGTRDYKKMSEGRARGNGRVQRERGFALKKWAGQPEAFLPNITKTGL